ncbi:MAG TPA: DUF4915 domain-containing protein [Lacipirellula sp.]
MDNVNRSRMPPPEVVRAKPIEIRVRGDFVDWLEQSAGTLAATTYNSGKLALFSATGGELATSFWRFPRPMGLAYAGGRLAIASQQHICVYRLANEHGTSHEIPPVPSPRWGGLGRGEEAGTRVAPLPSPPHKGEGVGEFLFSSNRIAFCREAVHFTGKVDTHDLAFDRRGLVFVNTRFNCIARPSERVSFLRSWQPWFVDGIQRKDCCHLNGVGIRAGRVAMATAFCERGAPAAWRDSDRLQSGVLIDVRRNAIAARGLCMPHSPRWHEGGWWFCDSGRGALCRLPGTAAEWNEAAVLPGFTRGLTFAAGRAIVGLSRIRKKHILDAPPVRQRFPRMRSGLWLVDPATGRTTGSLEFVRGGREVYDAAFLPNVKRLELVASEGA